MARKKKSYKYVYSPLILGGALVISSYIFFHTAELPGILVGLAITAIYFDPRWEGTPNFLHNILITGGVIIIVSSILWLFRLFIMKNISDFIKNAYETNND